MNDQVAEKIATQLSAIAIILQRIETELKQIASAIRAKG
jgi:hypothetical protein